MSKQISRRSFLGAALAAGAVASAGLAGCGNPNANSNTNAAANNANANASASSSTALVDHSAIDTSKVGTDDYTIRLGMTKGNPNPVAVINALAEGFFEEEKANVELTIIEDMGTGYSSVSADKLDMVVAMNLTLNRIAECEENLFMTGGIMSEGGAIFAAEDSDITLNGPEDFKGKTICGIQADSELIVIEDMLINAGMKAGTDYNVIYTDSMSVNIENVKKGTADLGILNGVPVYMVGVKSGCKLVAYNEDLVGKYPCCRMTVNKSMVTDHKLALTQFIIGELRGYQFFKQNKEKTVENLANFTSVDAESLEAVYYGTDSFRTAMEIIMDPQVDIMKKYYECYKTCGFIDPNTKYATDEYYYNEAYVAALKVLAEREPNEQLWKDMQAQYKTENTTYAY